MIDRIANRRGNALGWVLAGIAALVLPPLFPPYWLTILILAVIVAILAAGLNLLMGYTGLDSLGQAAFFGAAAYTVGLATAKYGISWWIAAPAGLLLAAAFAASFGLVAVRLKGLYFLLITLAFAQVLWGVTLRWGTFTGGWNGLRGVARPFEALGNPLTFYYVALAVLAVALAGVALVVNSPFGLALKGIRERELRSITLGFNTRWHKYLVFLIAGILGGIAGILNATYNGFVSPRDLSVELSFDAMLMVIVGGTGTLVGPVVGALVVTALRYLLSVYIENFWLIIVGLAFVAVTIWMPDGIVGLARRVSSSRRRARGPDLEVGEPVAEQTTAEKGRFSPAPASPTEVRVAGDGSTAMPPSPQAALALSGISMRFGDVRVLEDVSFEITAGERVGVIGLNGAGKTTLFNVVSGIHTPTNGSIELFGKDVTSTPAHIRNRLGLARTFQVTILYPRLTTAENVQMALLGRRYRRYQFSLWRRLSRLEEVQDGCDRLLEALGLAHLRDVEVRYLSYGHQRQVEIALALASEPDLLLLDEPTAGLAQAEMPAMLELLKGLPPNLSILLVEHNLEVIFEVVDRVVVLHQGRVLRDGRPMEIRDDPEIRQLYFGTHVPAARGTEQRGGAGGLD